MNHIITWNKGFLSDLYVFEKDNKPIGSLKDSYFKQQSIAQINNQRYRFNTSGFLNSKTTIYDDETNELLGQISYSNWMTKADILFANGTKFNWKYSNLWQTKWEMTDNQDKTLYYDSNISGGKILANTDNELEIISGLFVSHYYLQIAMVFIILMFFIVVIL